ncbi:MAG TPA: pseudouridine synthase [Terracidiphilus sp.]|jgi:23S rRNA pseudouridine2605 synthase
MSDDARRSSDQPEPDSELTRPEPKGPENDALEAEAASAAAASDTFEQAGGVELEAAVKALEPAESGEETPEPTPQPTAKVERLQKILAQAGIASRRHAEELITQGRVQLNGKVVTELGTKADPARDHIRVDGKLLQGSERQRYYMLNKPKGFVTTVSDPEGRPTIMQFFAKMRERLYPVGRLDYMSEGLLLVTNDGELANKLTRAASGVEKTYLVKVSGHPTETEIERLREGVSIDRVKPGSGRVQTAPANVRKVRHGDNPWYEVVIIEGRNRELRKMFEEIGHRVEKIRRVGYGPLVLDLEPGKLRELAPEEVEDLRKAAEGKYRKPKTRNAHKRGAAAEAQLPTLKPHWNPKRGDEARRDRSPSRPPERRPASGPSRPPNRGASRGPVRSSGRGPGSGPPRGQFRTPPRGDFRPGARFEGGRTQRPPRPDATERPFDGTRDNRARFAQFPTREGGNRPAWKNKPAHGSAPPRFDRDASPERGVRSERDARSERRGPPPNRSGRSDRRQPGEFRAAPPTARGPQRLDGKPTSGPGGFSGKKRLEIRPADEDFSSQDRPERRSFPPRGGPRPSSGRGPSAPSFTRKQRPQSDRDRRQDSVQRPRFDRDRGEHPRSDRPKPGVRVSPPAKERPNRPPSGPRPGGFKREGPGGRARKLSPNRGNVRSGGGRRPGSRPGGKPGGGKRRP